MSTMTTTTPTTPTTATSRPAFATAAAVALALGALLDFAHIAAYLSGADIPAGVLALKVAFGIAALVAAAGLWGRRPWAVPLALVVAVLNLLLSAWALVESFVQSGNTAEKVVAALGVLVGLAVIALVAPRAARRASA